jgi:hypothetical protein
MTAPAREVPPPFTLEPGDWRVAADISLYSLEFDAGGRPQLGSGICSAVLMFSLPAAGCRAVSNAC